MLRAADHVKHKPTGEKWVLAFGDLEDGDGRVSPCGWPETLAQAEDCELIQAASDKDHIAMLNTWADKERKGYDIRSSRARHYLSTDQTGQDRG